MQKPKRLKREEYLKTFWTKHCVICLKRPCDPSHIKTRGSGGDDVAYNVVAKCRQHHREWHDIGPTRFFEKYPDFKLYLQRLGWEIVPGKLWHPNMEPGREDDELT